MSEHDGATTHAEVAALRARLAAAEKTVAVLKDKVHALMSGAEKSLIEKQLVHIQRRAEALVRRRELSDLRARELERYSARLEREVRERTRAIRTILDHVTFGFLLVDADGRVLPGSTESCRELFGAETIDGRALREVLRLSPREAAEWSLGVAQVFDDLLPEVVALAQLRSRFVVGPRVLRVEARAVRDEHGEIARLLLSVTDVTAHEAAELAASRARSLVDILSQREAFERFLWDARERLEAAIASRDPATVRAAVHTVKGNAACFGLADVAMLAHDVEERGVTRGEIAADDVRRIAAALEHFVAHHREVLGADFGEKHAQRVSLSGAQLERLLALAPSGPPALRALVAELGRRPAAEMLGPVDRMVERLGAKLGKHIALEIEGGEVLVDPVNQDVFGVLGHLVRNAVDHGIEESGVVRIGVAERDDAWLVRVSDDGRGVDEAALARVAVERSLRTETEVASLSHDEKMQLVFVDGLSTAAETTDISGRGVGMSAVLRAVHRAHGALEIQSVPGRGTTVSITLPKSHRLAAWAGGSASVRAARVVPCDRGASPHVDAGGEIEATPDVRPRSLTSSSNPIGPGAPRRTSAGSRALEPIDTAPRLSADGTARSSSVGRGCTASRSLADERRLRRRRSVRHDTLARHWTGVRCPSTPDRMASRAKSTGTVAGDTHAPHGRSEVGPRMSKPSFSALVRDTIQEVLPSYRLVETVAGSAPELIYLRPQSPDRPLLQEKIAFAKLRWGLPHFDVVLELLLPGPAVGGSKPYAVAPLGTPHRVPIDEDLVAHLPRLARDLDAHASQAFNRYYSLYGPIESIAQELPELYLAWRAQRPAELASAKALMASELEGLDAETAELRRHSLFPFPGQALQERRLASFRAWLAAQGRLLAADDDASHWLRSFWMYGRPRTAEELKIDKHVGDECSVCRQSRSRGRIVEKNDPRFGAHVELVCSKCDG